MKKPLPKRAPSLTFRVMQLASAADAPYTAAQRHLLLVLALKANYRTGAGYAGQATLGAAMGVGARHVRRLWAELDALWERGLGPVAAHREARFHTSDSYQLAIAPWALEAFEAAAAAGPGVDRLSGNVDRLSEQVDRLSETGRPALGSRLSGGQPAPQSHLSAQLSPLTGRIAISTVPESKHSLASAEAGAGAPPPTSTAGMPYTAKQLAMFHDASADVRAILFAPLRDGELPDAMGVARRVSAALKLRADERRRERGSNRA